MYELIFSTSSNCQSTNVHLKVILFFLHGYILAGSTSFCLGIISLKIVLFKHVLGQFCLYLIGLVRRQAGNMGYGMQQRFPAGLKPHDVHCHCGSARHLACTVTIRLPGSC